MKFKSQICTTKEQSDRLLALGLKKETADMVLLKELAYDEKRHCLCDADTYMIRPIDYLNGEEHRDNIPAWSLHRLIEMMPPGYREQIRVGTTDNPYEYMYQVIGRLVYVGEFNKKYLEE